MGYIYSLTNKINNKKYIGQTTRTPEIRFEEHISEKNKDRSKNRKLYADMNKYGICVFKLDTIEKCDNSSLDEKEKYYIELYDTKDNGYNDTYGGKGTPLVNKIISENIINEYLQNKISINNLALKFKLCPDTISSVLKQNKIDIIPIYSSIDFAIKMDSKDNSILFNNFEECIQWLINNKKLKISSYRIKEGIMRVINGKRKSYLKLQFNKVG